MCQTFKMSKSFRHKIFGGNSFAKNLFKIKQILRLKGFFYGVFILKPLHIVLSMQTLFIFVIPNKDFPSAFLYFLHIFTDWFYSLKFLKHVYNRHGMLCEHASIARKRFVKDCGI